LPTHGQDLTVLSLTQLAQLTRRKRETIRRRLDGFAPVRTNGRGRYYDSAGALEMIFVAETIDLSRERARLARAQAQAQELKNQETEGRLLDFDDVVQTWSMQITAAKSKLRAIPKTLVSRSALPKRYVRVVLRRIDEALAELGGDGVPPQRKRRVPARSATGVRS